MTSTAATTGDDLAAYEVLGQLTGRAFVQGQIDVTGLAELTRHVLDLDLARAQEVLDSAPKTTTVQRI